VFRLIRDKNAWDFAAFGKHPAAGDYLSLGAVTPLLKGFSAWMEKGYSLVEADKRPQNGLLWRFWAKGPNGKLICGILKNSHDKHGRPFPLMIAGEGRVPDSAKDWDLIPFACERTWQILTLISSKDSNSIKNLKRVISRVKGPINQWESYREKREQVRKLEILTVKPGSNSDFMNKMNNVDGLSRKEQFSLWIDVGTPEDCLIPLTKFLVLLKNRSKIEPATVFIGGNENRNRLLFLKRSLMMDDFKTLWVSHPEEV